MGLGESEVAGAGAPMRQLVALLLCIDATWAADGENPYTATGDTTQECYAWAADGQCVTNPGYMHSNCKYSCWEWYEYRKSKYPDAPIDKAMDCWSWAKDGEYVPRTMAAPSAFFACRPSHHHTCPPLFCQ